MAELGFLAFDADNHYYEALDAFTRHIEPRLRRRAVQWAHIDGKLRLLVCGRVNYFIPNPTFDPVAKPGCLDAYYRGENPEGKTVAELFGELVPIDPAYRDREVRLKVMDAQGLEKVFLFPTLGVGMEESMKGEPEVLVGAFRAFNRWLDEDWGFSFRERLYAAPMVTLVDPAAAVGELEWALSRDARLLCLRAAPVVTPEGSRSPADPCFDPFWARVNEAGVAVAFHGGDHGYSKYAEDWGEGGDFRSFKATPLRALVMGDRAPFDTFAALVCHGLFQRFPNLRVASVEMGSDWVRLLLRRFGQLWRQMPYAFPEDPVAVFKRHVWVSPFHEEDVKGLGDLLGAHRLLMGSDFPHAEGIPEPTDYVHHLAGFSPEDVRRIMRDNALALAQHRPVSRATV
jgi:predicted TIM-barrel fold metal-dependent hydrolase